MRFSSLILGLMLASSLVGAASVPDQAHPDVIQVVGREARTSKAGAASYFTGHAQVEQLFGARDASRGTGGVVTFDAGARSGWHTHPVGQILIVTAGNGLVQQWGAPAHEMKVGDVVWIPAGVKHWHGASATSSVTHIAIQEIEDGRAVDWLEPVTASQYAAANQVR